ncbi:ATP-binding protein [Pseudomonas sp. GX19020]|uniref:ATP-binding protein n=1 Tax=Pseudomonas sp. GX19020 TaxID=2942277 RepID=UPI002019F636|nr:ATP-binding protein [Pseudomonas sp. GX19020]MCL4065395.1 ATP-binding protein [Pseudomonas sp. GX19020]
MRIVYREAEDEAAELAGALPDNAELASLPVSALRIATRAPDAREVVRQLRSFLMKTPKPKGPQLSEVKGGGRALETARRIIADLQSWREGELRWDEMCRSLLLYGEPGTGKTYIAHAMGNSAGVGFVSASFADWQAMGHLGDMLKAMQSSFATARRLAPAVLFIDEIDSVGARGGADRNSDYRHQVINGFLQAMNSIAVEEGVIVVGACNDPSRIDPAVLRAGRFDIKAEVPLPCSVTILGILNGHLSDTFMGMRPDPVYLAAGDVVELGGNGLGKQRQCAV